MVVYFSANPDLLDKIKYSDHVLEKFENGKILNDFSHSFPLKVDGWMSMGRMTVERGGDGFYYIHIYLGLEWANRVGTVEYILTFFGEMKHRMFNF